MQAKNKPSPDARNALADLCRAYWYPLYALIRRWSRDSHEAQDLTQEFFATLLEKDFLCDVSPSRGRFRAFLLAAVKHFLANERDKLNAAKRGGGRRVLSLNAQPFDWESGESRFLTEPAHQMTPEHLFERQWAIALLDRVLARLKDEHVEAGKLAMFETLQPFLSVDRETANYADAARQLDLPESSVGVAAHRLRKRYRALLRDEIANTVSSSDEVEDELRHLFTALSGRPGEP